MNQTHIHLLINHLPIFGSMLGAFVLTYGLWKKNTYVYAAAYYVLIISTLGAVVAYLTGEAAEETVEHLQGISKSMLDAHDDSAGIAYAAIIASGVASVCGLVITSRKSRYTRACALLTLFISIAGFGLMARTGYLGGQIRHTEINSAAAASQAEESDDKD